MDGILSNPAYVILSLFLYSIDREYFIYSILLRSLMSLAGDMSGIFNAFYVLFVLEGSLTIVMAFLVYSQVEEDSRELFA